MIRGRTRSVSCFFFVLEKKWSYTSCVVTDADIVLEYDTTINSVVVGRRLNMSFFFFRV